MMHGTTNIKFRFRFLQTRRWALSKAGLIKSISHALILEGSKNFILPFSPQVHKCFPPPLMSFYSSTLQHTSRTSYLISLYHLYVMQNGKVVKAVGFSQIWRSRIKSRQVGLPCETRYEKSVGHVRRPSPHTKNT